MPPKRKADSDPLEDAAQGSGSDAPAAKRKREAAPGIYKDVMDRSYPEYIDRQTGKFIRKGDQPAPDAPTDHELAGTAAQRANKSGQKRQKKSLDAVSGAVQSNQAGVAVGAAQSSSLAGLEQERSQQPDALHTPITTSLVLGSKTAATAKSTDPLAVSVQAGHHPGASLPQKPKSQFKLPASRVPAHKSRASPAIGGDQATAFVPQPPQTPGNIKGVTLPNRDRWTYVLNSRSEPRKQVVRKPQKPSPPQASNSGHTVADIVPESSQTNQPAGSKDRLALDQDAAEDGGEEWVLGDDESDDDADGGLDEDDEEDSDRERPAVPPKPGRKSKNNAKPKKPKESEEERWRQVHFVIRTRDNNRPDPLGTHSETTGKMPYSQVASLYNSEFNKHVTHAAIEKRYRLAKDKYCRRYPEYPKDIIYRKPQPRNMGVAASHKIKITQDGQMEEFEDEEVSDPLAFLTAEELVEEKRKRLWRNGYGACKPPREITEAADIHNYFNLKRPIEPKEHEKWTTITALNAHQHPVGSVDVLTKDIRNNSLFYRENLQQVLSMDNAMIGVTRTTLTRYVDCISPQLRGKLPEYDFSLSRFRREDGSVQREPCVEKINWTMGALVDLYCVASELVDNHVRMLVLAHWLMLAKENRMPELDVEELSRLFRSIQDTDPGRHFWVDYIYFNQSTTAGVQWLQDMMIPENGWHYDFVSMMHARIKDDLLQPAWLEDQDPDAPPFCSTYHIHPHDLKVCKEGCELQPTYQCWVIAERILRAAQRDAPGELPDHLKPSRAKGADEKAITALANDFFYTLEDVERQVDDGNLEDGDFDDHVDDNEPDDGQQDHDMDDDSSDESLDERQEYDYNDEEKDAKPGETAQDRLKQLFESMNPVERRGPGRSRNNPVEVNGSNGPVAPAAIA
ncbi:hypothetical protein K491DRAFT_27031 [Lophiostoma macrostomum CBS 122681]|uniref:Uncharacterized protein n=1 Tax=Lophiostoma macrostomum CBS 122681 TaxID=1314788 RepID=A0A6A6T172_9PLEO|nr:hypothetical protein K491DRAFT_27031 [Lophiostoma macrostomum CBS 122681]